jgi:hypothetical protein
MVNLSAAVVVAPCRATRLVGGSNRLDTHFGDEVDGVFRAGVP